jgi:hypothetical protein
MLPHWPACPHRSPVGMTIMGCMPGLKTLKSGAIVFKNGAIAFKSDWY